MVHDGDTGQAAVDGLVNLLDVEEIDRDIFRSACTRSSWMRIYGGHVAGQAIVAAGRTVPDDRHVHSLHSYFVRPGDPAIPIVYLVDRVRDGRSFSTRRVSAMQRGEPIFLLAASFQLEHDGIDHQSTMPDVPDPESLPSAVSHHVNRHGDSPDAAAFHKAVVTPIDLRFVDDSPGQQPDGDLRTGPSRVWMRADGKLPDDALVHVAVLTYASDLKLLDSVLIRHGLTPGLDDISTASLGHVMWFERPFCADEWLLYSTRSPSASGGRGLASGRFYTQNGSQVSTVVQETMIRIRGG